MFNLLSVSGVLGTIVSVLLAILVLLVMITVHEFGHYIAGKAFGFKINEFAIGMGPAAIKKVNKKTGEIFSVRVLPLGGFCAFEGEDEDGNESPDAFNNKPPLKRVIVLIAGAFMNLITGILVLTLSVGIYGQLLVNAADVAPTTAEYQEYSLSAGDTILKIDGKTVYMATDISSILGGKKIGEKVKIKVIAADGSIAERTVMLRNSVTDSNLSDTLSSFGAIGVATVLRVKDGSGVYFNDGDYIYKFGDDDYFKAKRAYSASDVVNYLKSLNSGEEAKFFKPIPKGTAEEDFNKYFVKFTLENKLPEDLSENDTLLKAGVYSVGQVSNYGIKKVKFGFFETIGRGFGYSFRVAGTIFRTLGELLTGKLGISAVGGPITTITTTSSVIKAGGFNYFLEIMGFIGINLAVFNLLPIPALDGSRVVFCIIEAIRKKPVPRKIEGFIHAAGLVLLLGFCVLVDILQLF